MWCFISFFFSLFLNFLSSSFDKNVELQWYNAIENIKLVFSYLVREVAHELAG